MLPLWPLMCHDSPKGLSPETKAVEPPDLELSASKAKVNKPTFPPRHPTSVIF